MTKRPKDLQWTIKKYDAPELQHLTNPIFFWGNLLLSIVRLINTLVSFSLSVKLTVL